jgi:hypothetical protein
VVKDAKKAGIHSEEEDDDDYYVGIDAIPIEAERPLEVEASEFIVFVIRRILMYQWFNVNNAVNGITVTA